MSEVVKYLESGSVAHLIINRPDARNALNSEVIASLMDRLRRIENDPNIRCIVLSGEGEKSFCAGADLNELKNAKNEPERKDVFQGVANLIIKMQQLSKPIIGKVHGYALAGGCGLAAACDIVLASDDAQFGLPEINIGLLPMIVMAPIHRAIGRRALMELTLTGDRIDAERALEIGLVSRVHPKAELNNAVEELAASLAEKSPTALKLGKQAVYEVGEVKYFDSFLKLVNKVTAFSSMGDFKEGVSSFFEKRKPEWTGK